MGSTGRGIVTSQRSDNQGGFFTPSQISATTTQLNANTPSGVPEYYTVKLGTQTVWQLDVDRQELHNLAQTMVKSVSAQEIADQKALDAQRGVTHSDSEVISLAKERKLYNSILNTYKGRNNAISAAAQVAYDKTYTKAINDGHTESDSRMFASRRANDILARGLVNVAKTKTGSDTVMKIGKMGKKGLRQIKSKK